MNNKIHNEIQNETQNEINLIKNNNNLSSIEKNKAIQELINISNKNILNNLKYKNECKHYLHKKCNNFYFSCCDDNFDCLRCHNEMNTHKPILKYICCKKCNLQQEPSNQCKNNECNIHFCKSFCNICFVWSNHKIYHCEKCSFCRVGDKNMLFHCDNCEACFDLRSKESHICINKSFKDLQCLYCLESIFNSQDNSIKLDCSHIVHYKCYEKALESYNFKCPTCRKSVVNMNWSYLKYLIDMQPMPIEPITVNDVVKCKTLSNMNFKIIDIQNDICTGYFINWKLKNNENVKAFIKINDLIKESKKIDIYCNDCCKNSNVLFHYLGNECNYCGSFNTMI